MVVGVYDSGLGGVDILKKMIHKYPNHTYLYVADNKYCPYGIKYNDEILTRIKRVMDFFVHQNVDVVVIACNTASNLILKIKDNYNFPIYTILEANINLVKEKKINQLCVIGTSNLIRSEVFTHKLDNDIQYLNGSLLVKYIEEQDEDKIENEIKTLVKYVNKECDAILLACTHFPLYKNTFISLEHKKLIIEGSKNLIYSLPLKNQDKIQSIHIFLTKMNIKYETKIQSILKDNKILIHNISL